MPTITIHKPRILSIISEIIQATITIITAAITTTHVWRSGNNNSGLVHRIHTPVNGDPVPITRRTTAIIHVDLIGDGNSLNNTTIIIVIQTKFNSQNNSDSSFSFDNNSNNNNNASNTNMNNNNGSGASNNNNNRGNQYTRQQLHTMHSMAICITAISVPIL
eukprot:292760_1